MFRPIFAPCGHIFQTFSIWIKMLNEEIFGPMCFLYACLFIGHITAVFFIFLLAFGFVVPLFVYCVHINCCFSS